MLSDIQELKVLDDFDLLVNPFFFIGGYKERLFQGAVNCNMVFQDDVTFTTLANSEASGFL